MNRSMGERNRPRVTGPRLLLALVTGVTPRTAMHRRHYNLLRRIGDSGMILR